MNQPSAFAQSLTHVLSGLTILGLVVVVIWALVLFHHIGGGYKSKVFAFLSRYTLQLGFFISLGGIFLTLLYSEVFHYVPCDLCWFQRIFLYPQMFLFLLAWFRKDRNIIPYALFLSLIGEAFAMYHHLLQIGYNIYKPCSTAPFAVDCAKPSFIEYGFVTFPFMAVVLFGILILLTVLAQRKWN